MRSHSTQSSRFFLFAFPLPKLEIEIDAMALVDDEIID